METENKAAKDGTAGILIFACILMVAMVFAILKWMPYTIPPEGPYLGTTYLKGTVVGTPQTFGDDDENTVIFAVEGSDVLHFSEIPRDCGDTIADGSVIDVRVKHWNATGTALETPKSAAGFTRIGKVVCKERSRPSDVDVTAEEAMKP